MSETKLEPCPFCGGEATIRTMGKLVVWVKCNAGDDCLADGPVGHDEQSAIVAWNTRTPDAGLAASHKALVEALKEINKRRKIQNSMSDLFHIVIFRDGQIARKEDGKELCIGDLIDAALAQAEALNR